MLAATIAIAIVLAIVVGVGAAAGGQTGAGIGAIVAVILYLVLAVLMMWISIATGIKRLHDRGKSGAWLLVFILAPLVLQVAAYGLILADQGRGGGGTIVGGILYLASLAFTIWYIVELGCLRGTRGPNQYGPDPIPHIP
jgi:uncharacterized membrane protein YhaH (DUF805 family)